MKKEIKINIPEDLYQKVKRQVGLTKKFKNPDEIIEYVLREFIGERKSVYSKEEEEEIKKRLKDLGY